MHTCLKITSENFNSFGGPVAELRGLEVIRKGCTSSANLLISQQWMLEIAPNPQGMFPLLWSATWEYQNLDMFEKGDPCSLKALQHEHNTAQVPLDPTLVL